MPDRHEIPQMSVVTYTAFVDPSGGSQDSMTLAIVHLDARSRRAVLDCVPEKTAPFSPEAVVDDFVTVLQQDRVSILHGDKYAGE